MWKCVANRLLRLVSHCYKATFQYIEFVHKQILLLNKDICIGQSALFSPTPGEHPVEFIQMLDQIKQT